MAYPNTIHEKLDRLDAAPTKPLYEHDCDKCMFLGHWKAELQLEMRDGKQRLKETPVCDLYVCVSPNPTLIARYSSEPSDYSSGNYAAHIRASEPIAHAAEKAVNKLVELRLEFLQSKGGK